MRKWLTRGVRCYLYVLAFSVILIAILLQSVRVLAPKINMLTPSIEQFLSKEMSAKASIRHLDADWYGLRPHVTVNDLEVVNDKKEILLAVEQADLELDILSSLLNFEWIWKRVVFQQIDLAVKQDIKGQWSIAGFSPESDSETSWDYRSPVDIFKITQRVELANAKIHVTFANKKKWLAEIPVININNSNGFHRLIASADIDGEQVFSLVFEKFDSANKDGIAAAYVKFDKFPIEKVVESFSPVAQKKNNLVDSSLKLRSFSIIDAQVWFDFSRKGSFSYSGNVSLANADNDLSVGGAVRGKRVEHTLSGINKLFTFPLQADFVGAFYDPDDWSVGLRNIFVDGKSKTQKVQLSKRVSNNNLHLALDEVDLKQELNWLQKNFEIPKNLQQILAQISVEGGVKNILAKVDLADWQSWTVSANAVDISTQPSLNIPGFKNVNGYVQFDRMGGLIDLLSDDFHIYPNQIYDKPLLFDHVKSQIAWYLMPQENRFVINSSNIHGSGDFGSASGYFMVDIPWKQGSRDSEFVLQLGLKNSDAEQAQGLIPNRVPKNVRSWLSESVLAGMVDQAGFIYRGGFSGGDNSRTVQLFLDMHDGQLAYSHDWPQLENITSHIYLDNRDVNASVSSATIYDELVNDVSVKWTGASSRLLKLKASGKLSAKSGLYLLNNSWLRSKVGDTFVDWSAKGKLNVDLDLKLPLLDPERSAKQNVSIGFNRNVIKLKEQNLNLQSVKGQLLYSDKKGLSSKHLSLSVFGHQLPITVKQHAGPNVLSGKEGDYLSVRGGSLIEASSLMKWLDNDALSLLSGVIPYEMDLSIPLNKNTDQPNAVLAFQSNLKGVDIDLPEPFGKSKQQLRRFTFTSSIYEHKIHHSVSSGELSNSNRIDAEFNILKDSQFGFLSINQQEQSLKGIPDNTFSIFSSLKTLDIAQWLPLLEQYKLNKSANGDQIKNLRFNTSVDTIRYNDLIIDDVTVVGSYVSGKWNALVKNNMVQGSFFIDDTLSQPMRFDLDYLRLEKEAFKSSDKVESEDVKKLNLDPWQGFDLSLFKPASVTIKELVVSDKPLGYWEFLVQPQEDGVNFTDIKASFSGLSLGGYDLKAGANLFWLKTSSGMMSQFNGSVVGSVDKVFNDWGLPPLLESQSTNIQGKFSWSGSPAYFAIERLKGDVKIKMEEGLFLQRQEQSMVGVLKLFGLFNFDTWARRIRLDFSDIYKKGIVFDEMTGRMIFNEGWIYLQEPLQVKSPSSGFSLAGTINYPKESIDGLLVTTLPVSGNLTFVTALAAGLPAAAGVYLVSKIFKSQVDKASSLTYTVKGGWDDPQVKFYSAPKSKPEKTSEGADDNFQSEDDYNNYGASE